MLVVVSLKMGQGLDLPLVIRVRVCPRASWGYCWALKAAVLDY